MSVCLSLHSSFLTRDNNRILLAFQLNVSIISIVKKVAIAATDIDLTKEISPFSISLYTGIKHDYKMIGTFLVSSVTNQTES